MSTEPGERVSNVAGSAAPRIRIAHLSDVHLGPVVGFTPRYWNLKRLVGFYNWQVNRRAVHRPEVVAALLADLAERAVDHVAVTGDLVNIGLPAEHAQALDWLRSIGPPERVSVVPGNHDIYTSTGHDPGAMRWRRYMACDERGLDVAHPDQFPYVRRIGEAVLIGVNSAIHTAPGRAIGRVGTAQRERLASALERHAGTCRIVMIHHPPVAGHAKAHHELIDAMEVDAVLRRAGAELVIHGHNHTDSILYRPASRPVPVIGVASASAAVAYQGAPCAGYNIYEVVRHGADWSIEMERRGLVSPSGDIALIHRQQLRRADLTV
jgi:3',5'-cyclic AMP phosphodiesterase CpdA